MRHSRHKSFILFAILMLTLAVALAASHYSTSQQPLDEIRSTDRTTRDKSAAVGRSQQLVAPESLGPIDRNVIAGGGGTSSGGNFRVDSTIGETSASSMQSGGAFKLEGGFWSTFSTEATPTPTPTPNSDIHPYPYTYTDIYTDTYTDTDTNTNTDAYSDAGTYADARNLEDQWRYP